MGQTYENGPAGMKLLRYHYKIILSEHLFCSNHRVQGAKSCVITIDFASRHSQRHQVPLHYARFVVRLLGIISTDQKELHLTQRIQLMSGFDPVDKILIQLAAPGKLRTTQNESNLPFRKIFGLLVHSFAGVPVNLVFGKQKNHADENHSR